VKNPSDQKALATEIEVIRDDLGRILTELDRRRRELLDPRVQLRRHPAVAVTAGVVAAALGGTIALLIWNRRRQSRPAARARELRRAVGRLLHDPRRVAKETSMGAKIATAAGSAAASLVVKKLVSRALARIPPPARA
jgi:hypothetical protein